MRTQPQPGLSRAIRSINAVIFGSAGGQPGRFGYVQCRATTRRRHASTVAGVTRRWLRGGPTQHLVLVPQHQQLRVQARTATGNQGQPAQDPTEHEVSQPHRHR